MRQESSAIKELKKPLPNGVTVILCYHGVDNSYSIIADTSGVRDKARSKEIGTKTLIELQDLMNDAANPEKYADDNGNKFKNYDFTKSQYDDHQYFIEPKSLIFWKPDSQKEIKNNFVAAAEQMGAPKKATGDPLVDGINAFLASTAEQKTLDTEQTTKAKELLAQASVSLSRSRTVVAKIRPDGAGRPGAAR